MLHPVTGHEALRKRLLRAAGSGRLAQSMLLHGPYGIGKQRLALWLAGLLLCERSSGCGECRSCRLSGRLEHPDLHWYFPVARPRKRASSSSKLREALEEARLAEIARRREDALAATEEEGPRGIYLGLVQKMRERAATRPALGRRAVFIVGEAESMVPQAANPEAANAFLKLLEEPPADTFFILTAQRPDGLLPTIRSRVLSIRVAPLQDEEVGSFLTDVAGWPHDEVERLAPISQGSIGRAIRLRASDGGGTRDQADALLGAALGSRRKRLEFLVTLPATRARSEFAEILEAAEQRLRDATCVALDQPGEAFDAPGARRLVGDRRLPADALSRAADHLHEARTAARGNVNPQAIASVLLMELASVLGDDDA
jgi:DNA polymerase-3 subunit delta'